MLIALLRTHLAAFKGWLVAVAVLQAGQTMATLLLPTLNADIIDKGIATGDTGYIWRMGGWMLLITVVQIFLAAGAVYNGCEPPWGSVETFVAPCSTPSRGSPPARYPGWERHR
ncbi:MAG: hypothetical protein R2789_02250 [Microthrixaceae bacterium]